MSLELERWSRIDKLFHSALEREPAARTAFLAEACGDDDSLRTEVESLLAADGKVGNFLECRAEAVGEGLECGVNLGPYQIAALIGRGGMGQVYRAHDTRLAREVAVKMLPRLALT